MVYAYTAYDDHFIIWPQPYLISTFFHMATDAELKSSKHREEFQ